MPNPKLVPFASQIRIWYFGEELIESRFVRELRARGYDTSSSAMYRWLKTHA